MTKEEAEALQALVETILGVAFKDRHSDNFGAVNWGDLRCIDVEEHHSLLTDSTVTTVIISEASPDAVGLQQFVGERLEAHGHMNVQVITEW